MWNPQVVGQGIVHQIRRQYTFIRYQSPRFDLPQVPQSVKLYNLAKSMTVAAILAFACIEYDDLFSLEWLLEALSQVEVKEFYIAGWNLYHTCAFFGRREIAMYLEQILFKSTINEACNRKPYQGYFAVHIALARGFTQLLMCYIIMDVLLH